VIWSIVFVIAYLAIVRIIPNIDKYMSITFIIGQWFGVIVSGYKALTKKGRDDLNLDFWDRMEKYKI
jgi:hypothetical protein